MMRTTITGVGIALALVATASAQFTISGLVTDSLTGLPVDRVDVLLFDNLGNPIAIPNTRTDITGTYSILNVPPGTYGLSFEPKDPPNVPVFQSGVVVAGNTVVNAILPRGNVVSGFVLDTLGQPVVDIDLNVYDHITGVQYVTTGDNTDGTGFYSIVVPSGLWRIRFRSIGIGALPWVTVDTGNIQLVSDTVINMTMIFGRFVSGTVRDNLFQPVVNANMDFIDTATGVKILTLGDNTDGTGQFQTVVPVGVFDVIVKPLPAYKLLPGEELATTINVDTSMTFTLQPGLSLSGTVTDNLAQGVGSADIDVTNSATGIKLRTPWDKTDASGFYDVIVPPGTYDLGYQPPVSTHLAPAESLSVSIFSDMVVNVTVPPGIILSGLVENSFGVPMQGIDIDAQLISSGLDVPLTGDLTDATGNFAVAVEPDLYNIAIEPDKASRMAAVVLKSLSLTADTSIFVALDTGMLVSGTITDSAGIPLAGASVYAIVASSGDTVHLVKNNSDFAGFYSVLVPTGTYNFHYRTDTLSAFIDSAFVNNNTVNSDKTINVSFSGGLPACCVGTRGDMNGDGADLDIVDLTCVVDFLFGLGCIQPCPAEADPNGDSAVSDIVDLTFVVDFLFGITPTLVPCP
ncbi:MAG: carboxypeptidase-like regulatory domain-containing protein [Candidatus Zixiibacteriota bacterium]